MPRTPALLAENLIAQGAATEGLTHTIAALNDAMTERVFDRLLPTADLDGLEGARTRSRTTARACSISPAA